MCGVFGFVANGDKRVNVKRLQAIAKRTEARGPHAFGFAWVDRAGRLRCFKQAGRISQSLDLLTMAGDARLLIGHTRYATMGDPSNNLNNHPHPVDGGWLVHNGQLRRYRELIAEHDLYPVTQCDSELLGLLIEDYAGSLLERSAAAVEAAASSPLAMLALWRSPMKLVAVRAGNPIHCGQAETGLYFGSFADSIPGAKMLPDNHAFCFTPTDGEPKVAELPLNCDAVA